MRSRKSRRGEWTTTKRGRIVHLAASPPQSLRDYINRARTTSPSATRMSHKDWTNFGGQLKLTDAPNEWDAQNWTRIRAVFNRLMEASYRTVPDVGIVQAIDFVPPAPPRRATSGAPS